MSAWAVFVLSACAGLPTASPVPDATPVRLTAAARFASPTPALPPTPAASEYATVAEALVALNTRADVSIARLQGWTIVTAADGLTNWSFPPKDHPAYPAMAKRVLYRDRDGWHLKMDILCEAQPAACEDFKRYFETLNEPIYQFTEPQLP